MSEIKESRLSGYYAELQKFIDSANYSKVIKGCNKILSEQPGEVKAWQCKVVALMQQYLFTEALTTIAKSNAQQSLGFEKSYCEYRLNDIVSAVKTISLIENPSERVKELHAQILYRLERYSECYSIYREIIRSTSDEFDSERQTNMAAVAVGLALETGKEEVIVASIDSSSSYELVYNSACQLLIVGRLTEALELLRDAERRCRNSFNKDEGATEEEIAEETAIIKVQQAECLQLLGREREALALYNSVLKSAPDDTALMAIVNNNLVTLNRGGGNVFDSRKRLKVATGVGLEHKLTSLQRAVVALNQCLLAYHTNQTDICRSECDRLPQLHNKMATPATVIRACLLGKTGQVDEAVGLLKDWAKERPELSTQMALVGTQICLMQGDTKRATEVLADSGFKDRFRAGVVSTRVAIFSGRKETDGAAMVLREAVEWHRKNKTSSAQLCELWRRAADLHLRAGDAATAAASLLELRQLDSHDTKTIAQLVVVYAQLDMAKARSLSRELPRWTDLSGDLDPDVLESALGAKYFRKGGTKGEASPSSPKLTGGTNIAKKSQKKRKRKPHLPLNYNQNVAPDADRWLPRWQRKGYRKKKERRGGNKEVGRGTQGGASDAADKFDITKTAGTHKPLPGASATAVPEATGPKRNMPKKKAGGGKKKKAW